MSFSLINQFETIFPVKLCHHTGIIYLNGEIVL